MQAFRTYTAMVILSLFLLPSEGFSPAHMLRVAETESAFAEGELRYTRVDAERLSAMLAKKDFFFINVHIPYEGEIEKTDLFIPYNEIEKNIDKLPADRAAKIVLYCRTDRMSNIAAETLVKLGYKDVWVMEGGMILWERSGRSLLYKGR